MLHCRRFISLSFFAPFSPSSAITPFRYFHATLLPMFHFIRHFISLPMLSAAFHFSLIFARRHDFAFAGFSLLFFSFIRTPHFHIILRRYSLLPFLSLIRRLPPLSRRFACRRCDFSLSSPFHIPRRLPPFQPSLISFAAFARFSDFFISIFAFRRLPTPRLIFTPLHFHAY